MLELPPKQSYFDKQKLYILFYLKNFLLFLNIANHNRLSPQLENNSSQSTFPFAYLLVHKPVWPDG